MRSTPPFRDSRTRRGGAVRRRRTRSVCARTVAVPPSRVTMSRRYDHERMAYVGDSDRERTAGALRRHYVEGRLTEDELSSRLDQALRARTRIDLLLAARSLPGHGPLRELLGPHARAVAGRAKHVLVLAALAGLWVLATVLFAVAFLLTVVVKGASAAVLAGFPLAWALLTWALWHAARRRP